MSAPPWKKPRGLDGVLAAWRDSDVVRPCVSLDTERPARAARHAPLPSGLPPELREALARRGIRELYAHQSAAIEAALGKRHVVIATPTASGKSLCFHLPVLAALGRVRPQRTPGQPLSRERASALYLYPTKALSRDQEHSLQQLLSESGAGTSAMVYDGDTPGDVRRKVREECRIVLTNPDMLHSGILPNHLKWASMFQGLEYVVLDELHTYRGVFGSHMAHVLSRLQRVARLHGADPTFICATATIGNPREHAARLIGVDPDAIALIDDSGAPEAGRRVLVYNPPVVNAQLGVRGSALKHAVRLTADLVRARVPTIVFGRSRNSVEVMLKYLREECRGDVDGTAIMAYRGGYLPATRRSIEAGLREGRILCVVATNALELGIDVGDLDAVVCVGYPGSVAGTWQRFGRAGRRSQTSIALLVCSSDPVDQFLAQQPARLMEASAEEARIDPTNVEVVVQHLKCAAFEAPFELSDPGQRPASPAPAAGEGYARLSPAETRDALEYLAGHGLIHASGGKYFWAGEAYPATHVSLRNIGWDNFVIIDVETDQSIAELDWRSTHTMLHEQAIYQHDAGQYQVERLDYENHKAYVRAVKPDYFTTALTYRTVEAIEQSAAGTLGRARIGWGDVKVVEKVTGYKKIKFFTHENAGYGDVHLPEIQMHTTAFWLTVPEALVESLDAPRAEVIEALRGLGAALETVATLSLMCEPSDIGRTLGDGDGAASLQSAPSLPGRNPHTGRVGQLDPTIFLFDAVPGGVGLAQTIHARAASLLDAARALIRGCGCESGCPACIGPAEADRRKALTLELVDALRAARPPEALPRAACG